jgi:hypothetical protein
MVQILTPLKQISMNMCARARTHARVRMHTLVHYLFISKYEGCNYKFSYPTKFLKLKWNLANDISDIQTQYMTQMWEWMSILIFYFL